MNNPLDSQSPKKKAIFNPLKHDFVLEYKDDDNNTRSVTVPSYEIAYFPEWLANLVSKHLVDEIYNNRQPKLNPELDKLNIAKEIEEPKLEL